MLNKIILFFTLFIVMAVFSQCRPLDITSIDTIRPSITAITTKVTLTRTQTASVQEAASVTPEVTSETGAATQTQIRSIWICQCLPRQLFDQIKPTAHLEIVNNPERADFHLTPIIPGEPEYPYRSDWVFALVAPFPTILDTIDEDQFVEMWQGKRDDKDLPDILLMSQTTYDTFQNLWGEPSPTTIKIMSSNLLLEKTWSDENTWAVIPFEELDPRWKVIKINNISPLDKNMSSEYLLIVQFAVTDRGGEKLDVLNDPQLSDWLPKTNRDENQLTSLILTGTTALVRSTALKMEENGITYPAMDIAPLLRDADITHISNEAPFYQECPPAKPVRLEQRFCSDPSYFSLLEYIDADVIELTGNHILDWGNDALLSTIQLYEKNSIPYYGGGKTLMDARKVLNLEDHNNLLAFIGCSQAGPEAVFATENSPGSNPCDRNWLTQKIDASIKNDVIPIVTFQHFEVEDYFPHSSQRIDFIGAAEAGAVIVSGSQSHFAQTMTFVENRFVHYGLGNLFFDQMYGENPKEFIDRHYFYNGQYISTELITAILEDSSKPRLMTVAERQDFLQTIFERCDWTSVFRD